MTGNERYPLAASPSPAEIEWHIANGRRLRAEATATALVLIGGWIRRGSAAIRHRVSRWIGDGVGDADTVTRLRSPLTAIRSAAEILRDNPDMTASDRARFVDILLAEEQRLERLVSSLIPDGVERLARR